MKIRCDFDGTTALICQCFCVRAAAWFLRYSRSETAEILAIPTLALVFAIGTPI